MDTLQPGQKALNDLGWKPSLQDRVRGYFFFWQHHERNNRPGADVFASFEALSEIARHVEHSEGRAVPPNETSTVQVPWWIIKTLALSWMNYRSGDEKMDKVFGMARIGRGRRGAVTEFDLEHRDLMLALAVHHERRTNGLTVEDACASVAASNGVDLDDTSLSGEATVTRAFKKYRALAEEAYNRHEGGHEEPSL